MTPSVQQNGDGRRIGVLSLHNSKETKAILNAIKDLGHQPVWLRESNTTSRIQDGQVTFEPEVDVAVNRLLLTKDERPIENLSIAILLDEISTVLNPPSAVLRAMHKYNASTAMVSAGVPVPDAFLAFSHEKFNRGRMDFNGTATGVDSVAIYVIDDNGNANVQLVDVNQDDNTFDEDDYSLASRIDPGKATIISASVSRDGVLGDNTLTDAGRSPASTTGTYLARFATWVNTPTQPHPNLVATTSPNWDPTFGVDDRGLSHDQILNYLVSQTTGDDGSDDLANLKTFRFT
ncbi:MAG: hypothetical protein ABEI86_14370, partial [Halobacteriaceae archaeon]